MLIWKMYKFLRNITKNKKVNSTNSNGIKENSTNSISDMSIFFIKSYPTICFAKSELKIEK